MSSDEKDYARCGHQIPPGRTDSVCPQCPATRFCAAGRQIVRPDGMHGVDWARPCPQPPDLRYTMDFSPHPIGLVVFCQTHGRPVFDYMYQRLCLNEWVL